MIGRILAAFTILAFALGCPVAGIAQTTSAAVVAACGTPPATYPAGSTRAVTQDTTGKLCDSGGGGGTPTNPSVIAGRTAGSTTVAACVDTNGVFCAPKAGTADRVVTKTSIAGATNTTICPAATVPVSTEIYFTTAAVGVGLNGQTLSQATWGATTTTPDIVIGTAGTLYTFPVGPTNQITAYGAAGGITCIQTIRQ